MPLKKFSLQDGNELRGMRIRLYPDVATVRKLDLLSADLKHCWNWLVKQAQDTIEASRSYAIKQGLVDARPTRPNYDGLEPTESKSCKEQYREACLQWAVACGTATRTLDISKFRKLTEWQDHFGCKQDYQVLQRVISWKHEHDEAPSEIVPGCSMLQGLIKNYFSKNGTKRLKRFKRRQDCMPIQVRSGDCFELGEFGSRGKNTRYYNCRVSINGLKIRGRLPGRLPGGRVLQGVSVTSEADGWWASIKVEQPIKIVPSVFSGTVVGIDVGLTNIAAFNDGTVVSNSRDGVYSQRIAMLQQQKRSTARLQQRQSRQIRHRIYSVIMKHVQHAEVIKIERLDSDIGQRGSRQVSVMRTVATMLKARFGDRVREVDPAYTSQDCSQCGKRDKVTWGYVTGPVCTCTGCGYRAHRDVNAARNIAARPSLPL